MHRSAIHLLQPLRLPAPQRVPVRPLKSVSSCGSLCPSATDGASGPVPGALTPSSASSRVPALCQGRLRPTCLVPLSILAPTPPLHCLSILAPISHLTNCTSLFAFSSAKPFLTPCPHGVSSALYAGPSLNTAIPPGHLCCPIYLPAGPSFTSPTLLPEDPDLTFGPLALKSPRLQPSGNYLFPESICSPLRVPSLIPQQPHPTGEEMRGQRLSGLPGPHEEAGGKRDPGQG